MSSIIFSDERIPVYLARAADNGAGGAEIAGWQHALEQSWSALRFGEVKLTTDGEQHVFKVQVYLDELDPEAVRVELYANGINGAAPERMEMKRVRQLVGAKTATPIVEEAHILWQR